MEKKLKVISINYFFHDSRVENAALASDWALFNYDVVVIRPQEIDAVGESFSTYQYIRTVMNKKRRELSSFFVQGGVLVVLLDVPNFYSVDYLGSKYSVNNYSFLDEKLASCLMSGRGDHITYSTAAEPFVNVLKSSDVLWTAYITKALSPPLDTVKFFAHAGAGGALAGKTAFGEGHLIVLPNFRSLDEKVFLEACHEYRFKRQGTPPPDWAKRVPLPGCSEIQSVITDLDKQLAELQQEREVRVTHLEQREAYRKLLYEKGKAQLEPIVLRALDDLEFKTSPSEIIEGTIHEIDGRTGVGSIPGIVEVKGSKNQIAQSEFSPFITKIVADADVKKSYSKGIMIGNGFCEKEPATRLGETVFSPHVIDGAKRNSIALINSVELYWLCCALLRGDSVDKNAVREKVLSTNGYVDLKPFCGAPLF